jgi:hypothetical protein
MELFRSRIVLVNDTTIGSRELDRMAHNGAEHSLEVEGRADRLTDLAQRSKLADRLREIARPIFEFFKEPDVLYSNHGLIGEGLKQGDLFFREGMNLCAPHMNRANRNIFTHQWYS